MTCRSIRQRRKGRPRGARSAALGLAAAAALLLSVPASGDHGEADPGWPQLLPPVGAEPGPQGHAVHHCRRPGLRCIRGLERRLERQWRRFDRRCDHRAVVAYSYMRITRGLRKDLAGPRPGLVRHRRWMTWLITTFSNRYFDAFRDYAAGRPVADSWRIAFRTYDEGDANAGQDVLLFSNAHVQHDLPFALAEMGIATRSGRSRKLDHDAVNRINTRVFDPIEDYIAAHYDPDFRTFDAKPSPFEEMGTLELVKSWRERAWRDAERLLQARSEEERRRVIDSIDANSRAWAELISSGEKPGHREVRDAYCREHHETGSAAADEDGAG